ncbi:PREDICTED: uncharacterized protein LOC106106894 [Papilio polytes]|uniref:uncharacterized protein LOC106106894 n=1 Tax=Papilio polytes TaxID=76194 RepID=UPI0006761CA1|nr:PREDICTED: uncharacterized protein LOC106106894 [Papilio polytes]
MGMLWVILFSASTGLLLIQGLPVRPTPLVYPHGTNEAAVLEGWRPQGLYMLPVLALVVTALGLLFGCTWCYRHKDCKPNAGADNQLFAPTASLHNARAPPDAVFPEPVNNNISEDNNNGPISLREMQNIANNNAAAYIVSENEERNRISRESVVEFEPLPADLRVIDPLERCADWFGGEDLSRNRLQYLREIGRGWFGRVVEGELDNTGTSVAVKILNQNASLEDKARFLDEARIYRDSRHENILAFVAKCLEEDPWILLFELCSVDLQQYLIVNRPKMAILNESGVPLQLMCDVSSALSYLHSRGMLYGTLWCGSVMVREGEPARAVLGQYGDKDYDRSDSSMDPWVKDIITGSQDDVRYYKDVSDVIKNLDNILNSEKTSSSESSHQASPSRDNLSLECKKDYPVQKSLVKSPGITNFQNILEVGFDSETNDACEDEGDRETIGTLSHSFERHSDTISQNTLENLTPDTPTNHLIDKKVACDAEIVQMVKKDDTEDNEASIVESDLPNDKNHSFSEIPMLKELCVATMPSVNEIVQEEHVKDCRTTCDNKINDIIEINDAETRSVNVITMEYEKKCNNETPTLVIAELERKKDTEVPTLAGITELERKKDTEVPTLAVITELERKKDTEVPTLAVVTELERKKDTEVPTLAVITELERKKDTEVPTLAVITELERKKDAEVPTLAVITEMEQKKDAEVPTLAVITELERKKDTEVPTLAVTTELERKKDTEVPTLAVITELERKKDTAVPTLAIITELERKKDAEVPTLAVITELERKKDTEVPTLAVTTELERKKDTKVPTLAVITELERKKDTEVQNNINHAILPVPELESAEKDYITSLVNNDSVHLEEVVNDVGKLNANTTIRSDEEIVIKEFASENAPKDLINGIDHYSNDTALHTYLETNGEINELVNNETLNTTDSTIYLDLPSLIKETSSFLESERTMSNQEEFKEVVASTPKGSENSFDNQETFANECQFESTTDTKVPEYELGTTLTKLEQRCPPDNISPLESPTKSHHTDTYDENSSIVLGPFENCSLELFKAVKSEIVDLPKEELLAFSSNFSEMDLETPSPLRDGNFLNEVPDIVHDDLVFDDLATVSETKPSTEAQSDNTENSYEKSNTEKRISPSTPPNSPGVFLASTSQQKYLVDIDLTTPNESSPRTFTVTETAPPPFTPDSGLSSLQKEIDLNQIELQITTKLAMAENENNLNIEYLTHNEQEKELSHCSTYIIHDSKSEICETFSPDSITANFNTYTKPKTEAGATTSVQTRSELNDSTKNTQTKDLAYGTLMSGLPSGSNCSTELLSTADEVWKLSQPELVRRSPFRDEFNSSPSKSIVEDKEEDCSEINSPTTKQPSINKMDSVDVTCLKDNSDSDNKSVMDSHDINIGIDESQDQIKTIANSHATSTPLTEIVTNDDDIECIPINLPKINTGNSEYLTKNLPNFQSFLLSAEMRPQDISSSISNEVTSLNQDTEVLLEGESKSLSRNSKDTPSIPDGTLTYSDFEGSAVNKPQEIDSRETSRDMLTSDNIQDFRTSENSTPIWQQNLSSLIDASSSLLQNERRINEITMQSITVDNTNQSESLINFLDNQYIVKSPPSEVYLNESHINDINKSNIFITDLDTEEETEQPHSIIITESPLVNRISPNVNRNYDSQTVTMSYDSNTGLFQPFKKDMVVEQMNVLENDGTVDFEHAIEDVCKNNSVNESEPSNCLPKTDNEIKCNGSQNYATVSFLNEAFEELVESNVDDNERDIENDSVKEIENATSEVEKVENEEVSEIHEENIYENLRQDEVNGVVEAEDETMTSVTENFLQNEKKYCTLDYYLPLMNDIRFTGEFACFGNLLFLLDVASDFADVEFKKKYNLCTSFNQDSSTDPTSPECEQDSKPDTVTDILKEWDSESDSHSTNSSSGEFIWRDGDGHDTRLVPSTHFQHHREGGAPQAQEGPELSELAERASSGSSGSSGSEGDEVEFVPSSWDCRAEPAKSSLRSLDHATPDSKKRVVFKRQKYHSVYEYPREVCEATVDAPPDLPDFSTYCDWEAGSAEEAELDYGQLFSEHNALDLYPLRAGIAFGAGNYSTSAAQTPRIVKRYKLLNSFYRLRRRLLHILIDQNAFSHLNV